MQYDFNLVQLCSVTVLPELKHLKRPKYFFESAQKFQICGPIWSEETKIWQHFWLLLFFSSLRNFFKWKSRNLSSGRRQFLHKIRFRQSERLILIYFKMILVHTRVNGAGGAGGAHASPVFWGDKDPKTTLKSASCTPWFYYLAPTMNNVKY